MHSNKLIYRNLRPEKIRIKDNEPYFYDFSMSQFLKRKERLFEVVGCGSYLAPEFFSEDGYGQEVDIWSAGVLLYYLLLHEYPFKFKSEEENGFK
jgi:serine/threonine protein kinase